MVRTTIRYLSAKRDSILSCKLQQKFLACLAKIPGYNQVKIRGSAMQIIKVSPNTSVCSRCHGCTHIIGILNTVIHHLSNGTGRDFRTIAFRADQRRTGSCYCPLRSGRSLTAISQWKSVLTLRRGKMRGGHCNHFIRKATSYHQRSHQEAFRHG